MLNNIHILIIMYKKLLMLNFSLKNKILFNINNQKINLNFIRN